MKPFIAFEGLDHSGKSTLIKALSSELKKMNISFINTREPGGTPLGEKIRHMVLDPYGPEVSPITGTLLICASRRDHIEKVIRPQLESGLWVICDRFWASTYAFQGRGHKIPEEKIQWLKDFVVPKKWNPDLQVLLDLPVAEKEKRSQEKGTSSDRFEIESRDFHQRVREGYLELANKMKEKWLILNALSPVEELVKQVLKELEKRSWL